MAGNYNHDLPHTWVAPPPRSWMAPDPTPKEASREAPRAPGKAQDEPQGLRPAEPTPSGQVAILAAVRGGVHFLGMFTIRELADHQTRTGLYSQHEDPDRHD